MTPVEHKKIKYGITEVSLNAVYKNMLDKQYKDKVIISGNIFEFYHYEKIIKTGVQTKKEKESILPPPDWVLECRQPGKGDAWEPSDEELIMARFQNARRAKNKVRRLINSNVYQYYDEKGKIISPKFMTLTFADNVQDIKEANRIYTNFVHQLNRNILGRKEEKRGLKYLVVMEFQKRGAIHYHTVFFNLPFIKASRLAEIWGQGFVQIKKIKDVDNVGAYISKYLTKDYDDDRLDGKKRYFASKGLLKPYIEIDDKIIDLIKRSMSEEYKVFESTFKNEFTGEIAYLQYNLGRVILVGEI